MFSAIRASHHVSSILLLGILLGCGAKEKSAGGTPTPSQDKVWRYFDRELHFPTGTSVTPEVSAAQEVVKTQLRELETATDLGRDFFILKESEDSLLQPIVDETSYQGRSWKSFVQIWPDDIFNDFVSGSLGSTGDDDIVVARNEKNEREYYMVLRLACFTAGASCSLATETQAKAVLFRAFGYLVGLRDGAGASSAVMKPGISEDQKRDDEFRRFYAEFNSALERFRNDIPPPK